MHIRYMNSLYTSKTPDMYRPPFVAIFIEVLYEVYVTKTSQPTCSYKILSSKYMVSNVLKYKIQVKLFVPNLLEY
jgi:hypothetical protein